MYISGIGSVFSGGRGLNNFESALKKGWVAPSAGEVKAGDEALMAYRVSKETLTDKNILKSARRAGRFSKMAVLSAYDALKDSGIELKGNESSLGVIVATAFGAHVMTFGFVDTMFDHGDKNVSPTTFSHSVHNTAASYISSITGSRGPTLTISQFDFPFQEALNIAGLWLDEGRCRYVLLGVAEECGAVLESVWSKKWRASGDGKIRPMAFSKEPEMVPGEGSVFFMLTNEECGNKYCDIGITDRGSVSAKKSTDPCDFSILEADGMCGDESGYRNECVPGVPVAGYAPIFGSMMTGSAFQCAAAALMLKNQLVYGAPVKDNPGGIDVCADSGPAELKSIKTIRYNRKNKRVAVLLKKG